MRVIFHQNISRRSSTLEVKFCHDCFDLTLFVETLNTYSQTVFFYVSRLVSIFYYDCITIAGFAASFVNAILSQVLLPATIQMAHKLQWSDAHQTCL